jgi:hypothetical protein
MHGGIFRGSYSSVCIVNDEITEIIAQRSYVLFGVVRYGAPKLFKFDRFFAGRRKAKSSFMQQYSCIYCIWLGADCQAKLISCKLMQRRAKTVEKETSGIQMKVQPYLGKMTSCFVGNIISRTTDIWFGAA